MTHPPNYDDLAALTQAANDDMQCCVALIDAQPPSQFARRTFVRTAFAYVEAWSALTRLTLIAAAEGGLVVLSPQELQILRGEQHGITESGRVQTTSDRLPSGRRTVRFLLLTASRAYGLPTQASFSGAGWSKFSEAWAVRNRLTHPKQPLDLHVSDPDLETAREGHLWFLDAITRNTRSINAVLARRLARGV